MLMSSRAENFHNEWKSFVVFCYGRSDRIWTCGLMIPNHTHYQAVLRPEDSILYCQSSWYEPFMATWHSFLFPRTLKVCSAITLQKWVGRSERTRTSKILILSQPRMPIPPRFDFSSDRDLHSIWISRDWRDVLKRPWVGGTISTPSSSY